MIDFIKAHMLTCDEAGQMVDAKVLFSCFSGWRPIVVKNELRPVSEHNYVVTKVGNKHFYMINLDGVIEHLNCSKRLSRTKKAFVVDHLRSLGMQSTLDLAVTSLENEFGADLEKFLFLSGLSIKRQVPIGGYLADFVIGDDIVIEYDENNHSSYNKVDETARESAIAALGYRVVRLDGRLDNFSNLYMLSSKINLAGERNE